MEIKGKIIVALPELKGVSKSGKEWKKREYVLETQETYPKKVFFNFFGERADQYPMNVGDVVTLSFDINSREFNGRWYTDISGWKVEREGQGAAPQPAASGIPAPPAPAADFTQMGSPDEDIPF